MAKHATRINASEVPLGKALESFNNILDSFYEQAKELQSWKDRFNACREEEVQTQIANIQKTASQRLVEKKIAQGQADNYQSENLLLKSELKRVKIERDSLLAVVDTLKATIKAKELAKNDSEKETEAVKTC